MIEFEELVQWGSVKKGQNLTFKVDFICLSQFLNHFITKIWILKIHALK